ncbi:MAG: hypothetical protein SFT92_02075 [Rickettsiales bacterium]|nr:hypothetical protein [Rickettsiales bacterium]
MNIVLDIYNGARQLIDELNPFSSEPERFRDGSMEIGGVALPAGVVFQLQQLGVPLSSYTPGQLEAAVRACSYDNTLVDDHDAHSFDDAITLTCHEKQVAAGTQEPDYWKKVARVRSPKKPSTNYSLVDPLQPQTDQPAVKLDAPANDDCKQTEHKSFCARLEEERQQAAMEAAAQQSFMGA